MKYINRIDRAISHIYYRETVPRPKFGDLGFNIPLCNTNLGIWKKHFLGSSFVTGQPIYPLCKHCQAKNELGKEEEK